MAYIDDTNTQELAKYIEELTTSGLLILEEQKLKKIKNICRLSEEYVQHAYYLIMTQLEFDHAEIRYGAFLIICELFKRSHKFRELLVSDFQKFLELTVETDPDLPLPPPKSVAKSLRCKTLETIQHWYEKFGEGYQKLVLGYNFLKELKKIDFDDIQSRSIAERLREEQEDRRRRQFLNEKLNKTLSEFDEIYPEIQSCLIEMDNCFNLLLPSLEFMMENEAHPSTSEDASTATISSGYEPTSQMLDKSDSKMRFLHDKGKDGSHATCEFNGLKPDIKCELKSNSCTSEKINLKRKEHSPELCSGDVEGSQKKKEKLTIENKQIETIPAVVDQNTISLASNENELVDSNEEKNELHACEKTIDTMKESIIDESKDLRQHGLTNMTYNLTININPGKIDIQKDEDNADILQTLKEHKGLLVYKYLPTVLKWLEVFTKADCSPDKLKTAIDIKRALESSINKCNKLNVQEKKKNLKLNTGEESDDDDDFEEVPEKEGYEATVPPHSAAQYGMKSKSLTKDKKVKMSPSEWSLKNEKEDISDPTSAASTLRIWKQKLKDIRNEIGSEFKSKPSKKTITSISEQKKKLLAKAPKVRFDLDLLHWNEDKIEPPTVVRYDSLHRFWAPRENEEFVSDEAVAALRTRTIEFTGKFEPVQWCCRSPLPHGGLCSRQDRIKCPFHGLVIPRDGKGNPTNPKDIEKFKKEEEKRKAADQDWKDPEYLKDLEAATGVDLGSSRVEGKGKGKGKKSKKKYPNLTDLKASKNTVKKRLEAKVFNYSTMRRVSANLDALDKKRNHDKFGNSWAYAYNT